MIKYYILAISVITVIVTVYDKLAAKWLRRYRVPEKVLLGLGFFGGAAAEYITMKVIRHKTRHKNFMLGLPAMIVFHIVIFAVYYFINQEKQMLEVKNIGFTVADENGKGSLEIIEDVSFTLEDGKFLVITGPNGGGKSTLARLIMGIEKPTKGQILYNGTDITDLSITERAKLGIGYAFQQPPRFKGLTVRKLLSLAHGSPLPENECCSYLTKVGLCSMDYLNREVDSSLSGGEVKRIEIATLMARDLGLAIYDEPEAGIDLWSFSMLVQSFRDIAADRNESVMIISHQERIMQLADDILVVADGKIRSFGTKAEILPTLLGEFDSKCSLRGDKNA